MDANQNRWVGGLLGGIVGAAVFGVWMMVVTPNVIEAAIPALYGVNETLILGAALHLIHGVIFGLIFAVIVEIDVIQNLVEREPMLSDLTPNVQAMLAGLVYGLVLWVLLSVIVMPVWLETVGFADGPVIPNLAIESLVGHLGYGLILGAVYGAVTDR